nr:hypothetical protein GCM10020092_043710 [Actinoplanes digitatis]
MSLLQELGAQLRATSDELPIGVVSVAMERLRSATELLNWVRQTSVDPIGVPQLGNATEHAEHAAAALRLAQDAIAAYLAQLGLAGEASAAPGGDWKAGLREDEQPAVPRQQEHQPPPERLGPWWRERVEQLTGEAPPPPRADGTPQERPSRHRRAAAPRRRRGPLRRPRPARPRPARRQRGHRAGPVRGDPARAAPPRRRPARPRARARRPPAAAQRRRLAG